MALRPFFVPGLCTIRYLTRAFLGSPRGRRARRVTGQRQSLFVPFCVSFPGTEKAFHPVFSKPFSGGKLFPPPLPKLLFWSLSTPPLNPPPLNRTNVHQKQDIALFLPLRHFAVVVPPHAACCITDNISIFLAARPLPLSTKLHSKPQTAVLCCCC